MASILVCEDDPRIRDILVYQLKKAGHQVETVADGKVGLELGLSGSFDLIISDLSMPGLNGMELAEALHQSGKTTRLVILTAFVTGDLIDKLKAQPNVARIVSKPWDTKLLLEAIGTSLPS